MINLYKYTRLQKQIAEAHRYLKVTEKQEMNVQKLISIRHHSIQTTFKKN